MSAPFPLKRWILLRGLARESEHWGGFLDRLAARFPGVEILPLDLPGFGRSRSAESPSRVTAVVDWLRARLPRPPPGRSAVLGLSLGAMVAMEWVFRHPRDFSAAVWINPSSAWSPWFRRLRPLAALRLAACGLFPVARRERLILGVTSNDPRVRGRVAEEWVRIATHRPLRALDVYRQVRAAASFRPPAGPVPVPALLLTSDGDRLVHPSCSRLILKRYPGVTLRSHPSAGHDLPLDDPDWVVREIADWSAKIE